MKYLKKFTTESDYQIFISNIIDLPNVSFVEETNFVGYHPDIYNGSDATLSRLTLDVSSFPAAQNTFYSSLAEACDSDLDLMNIMATDMYNALINGTINGKSLNNTTIVIREVEYDEENAEYHWVDTNPYVLFEDGTKEYFDKNHPLYTWAGTQIHKININKDTTATYSWEFIGYECYDYGDYLDLINYDFPYRTIFDSNHDRPYSEGYE